MAVITPEDRDKKKRQATPLSLQVGDSGARIEIDPETRVVRLVRADGQDLILGQSLVSASPPPFSLGTQELTRAVQQGQVPPPQLTPEERREAAVEGSQPPRTPLESLGRGTAEGVKMIWDGARALEGWLAGEVAAGIATISGRREIADQVREIARRKFIEPDPEFVPRPTVPGPEIGPNDNLETIFIKLKNFILERPEDFVDWAFFNLGTSIPVTLASVASLGAGAALGSAGAGALAAAALATASSAGEIAQARGGLLETKDVPVVLGHAALEYVGDLVTSGALGVAADVGEKLFVKRIATEYLRRHPDATIGQVQRVAKWAARRLQSSAFRRTLTRVGVALSPLAEGGTEYLQSGLESLAATGRFEPSPEAAVAGIITGGVFGAAGAAVEAARGAAVEAARGPAQQAESVVQQTGQQPESAAQQAAEDPIQASFRDVLASIEAARDAAAANFLVREDPSVEFAPRIPPYLQNFNPERSRPLEHLTRPETGTEIDLIDTPAGVVRLERGPETAMLQVAPEVEQGLSEAQKISLQETLELVPQHQVSFDQEETLTYYNPRLLDENEPITPENIAPTIEDREANRILKAWRDSGIFSLREALQHPKLLRQVVEASPFKDEFTLDRHLELVNQLARRAVAGARGRYWYEASAATVARMFNLPVSFTPDVQRFLERRGLLRGVQRRQGPETEAQAILQDVPVSEDMLRQLQELMPTDLEARRTLALKFVRAIAVLSGAMGVAPNWNQAVNALHQYLQGLPITAGGDRVKNTRLNEIFYEGKPWQGEKTNSFFLNLSALLGLREGAEEVTVDRWIVRALGYNKESPTTWEYRYARSVIQSVADALGWTPMQVQAALWEQERAAAGKIKEVVEGVARSGGREEVLPVPLTSVDFSDVARRYAVQVSAEALDGVEDWLKDAPEEVRYQATARAGEIMRDVLIDTGLFPVEDVEVLTGWWIDESGALHHNPSLQVRVALPVFGAVSIAQVTGTFEEYVQRQRDLFGPDAGLLADGQQLVDMLFSNATKGGHKRGSNKPGKEQTVSEEDQDPRYGEWVPVGAPEEIAQASLEKRLAWWEQEGTAKGIEEALRWLIWRRLRFKDKLLERYRKAVISAANIRAAARDASLFAETPNPHEKWLAFWNAVNRALLEEFERLASSEHDSHPHFMAGISSLASAIRLALVPDSFFKRVEVAAHLINLIFDQKAVGWSYTLSQAPARVANQIEVKTEGNRPLRREEFNQLTRALRKAGLSPKDYVVVSKPDGARILLFSIPETEKERRAFYGRIKQALANNPSLKLENTYGASGLIERPEDQDPESYQASVLHRAVNLARRPDYPVSTALEQSGDPVSRAFQYYARARIRWINTLLGPEFGQYVRPEDRERLQAERERLTLQLADAGDRGLRLGGRDRGRPGVHGAAQRYGAAGRGTGDVSSVREPGGYPLSSEVERTGDIAAGSRYAPEALPGTVPGAGLYREGQALEQTGSPAEGLRGGTAGVRSNVLETDVASAEERRFRFQQMMEALRDYTERVYRQGTEGVLWASLNELVSPDGFRLYGRKIESIDDLARALMIYRNPNVEIFRAIFVDEEGNVLDEQAFSAFMPHFAPLAYGDWYDRAPEWYANHIQALSERTGKRVYVIFSHNHPSGRAVPSYADESVTATLASRLREKLGYNPIKGAFVTDSGVVSYVTLPEDYHMEDYGMLPWQQHTVADWRSDWHYEPKGFIAPDSQMMMAREILERERQRSGPGWYLIALSASWELRAILRFDPEKITKNPVRYFEAVATKHGAPLLIAVAEGPQDPHIDRLLKWKSQKWVSQVITLDWLSNSTLEDRIAAFSETYTVDFGEQRGHRLYEEGAEYGPGQPPWRSEKINPEMLQVHRLQNEDAPSEIASPATDPMLRAGVQMVDQVMRLEQQWPTPETFEEWFGRAQQLLDDPGQRMRIASGDIRTPEDVMAAKLLIDEIGQQAIEQAYEGNYDALDPLIKLVIGYRMARTEIARALAAGRDPVRGPAERFQEMVFGAIYNPTPDEIVALQNARTIEEREAVLLKIKERARKILQDLADRGWRLDKVNWHDAMEVAALVRQVQAVQGRFTDAIYEYWINAILSHPATHTVNFVSNAIQFFNREILERVIQAGLNLVLQDPDLPTFGEFKAMFRAFLKRALPLAWARARLAFRTEFGILDEEVGGGTRIKYVAEENRFAIPGKAGRLIRIPSRLLLAADELWKNLVYHSEMAALAYRIAKAEGLSGEALERRMDELMADPQGPVSQAAYRKALMVVFQEDLPPVIQKFARLRKDSRLLAYLFPFVRTPTNIFLQAIRYTPIGTVLLIRNFATGRFKSREEWARLLSEQTIGWMMFWTIALLSGGDDEDEDRPIAITGSRGVFRGERDLSYRVAPPTSIKIGDRWYSYSRLDPIATVLQVWVDTIDIIRTATKHGEVEAALKRIPEMMAGLVYDKTMVAALNDLVYIASRPGPGIARLLSRYATSFVPAIIRGAARAADPYLRESRPVGDGVFWTKDLLEKAFRRALVPWTLEPRIDIWGNPINVRMADRPLTDFLYRMLTPIGAYTVGQPHPADLVLLKWNQDHPEDQYWPVPPDRTFTVFGVEFYMPDSIYTEYLQLSGSIAAAELRGIFREVPEEVTREHVEIIERVIRQARQVAREMIIAKYEPEIYRMPRDRELAREAGLVPMESP